MGTSYKIFILLTWFISVRKSTFTTERKTGSGKPTANISNGHSIRTKAEKDRRQYIYMCVCVCVCVCACVYVFGRVCLSEGKRGDS